MKGKVLVTGVAGFIGSNLAERLSREGYEVVGIDNLNDYYDVRLKQHRIERLAGIKFVKGDISDKLLIMNLFKEEGFDVVVNLAAQAGVRYSIDHPDVYVQSNVVGFFNLLEACRAYPVKHLIFASSSSVYGGREKVPFFESDMVDSPDSLYAATKKSNELFAHAYSKLYGIPVTGLRFFTVYGPAGRPDMAYFKFTDKLLKGETIEIFNYGNCRRDFTYIDDVVEGVYRLIQLPPQVSEQSEVPYRIFNIGNEHPENLLDFVSILQHELCRAGLLPDNYDFGAHMKLVPMHAGDVPVTFASTEKLYQLTGFKPYTQLRDGLRSFVAWYKNYYCANK